LVIESIFGLLHRSKPYISTQSPRRRERSRGGGLCIAAKSPCNKLRLPSYGTEQTDFQLLPNNKEGMTSEETVTPFARKWTNDESNLRRLIGIDN
jgi:hypothetical protein